MKKVFVTVFLVSLAAYANASSADTPSQQAADRGYGNLHSQSLAPIKPSNRAPQSGAKTSKLTKQQAADRIYGNIHSNSMKPLNR
ncbi:hypothetical protein [Paraburkholderia tuberum]|uniref:hypothetical protein n=1 Tax=Paraburkholderia TaxID=1822464 RepID=UPI00037F2AB3|nr:hypothetical protein [Paraburkholderia tuberum]